MRILITNDDGIQAPGLMALCNALSGIAHIDIVAPATEQSAASQSITVHEPLRVRSVVWADSHIKAWAVGGTPTDCVKMAAETLLQTEPDLVISGINQGPNLGTDVLYSGTVSAAIEGAIQGFQALAISLDSWDSHDFTAAGRIAACLAEKLCRNPLPVGTVVNVNVPAVSERALKPALVTRLGSRRYENTFERRIDPRGREYYWMGGHIAEIHNDADTDVAAVAAGHVSITPLQLDMTDYRILAELKTWQL